MIVPPIPHNEQERLEALKGYSILDTLPAEEYDEITLMASLICQSPISLITLIDENRQWFKSRHGINVEETPRELAFCAHAILTPDKVTEVADARLDERFHDNPFVVGEAQVIFYTGVPLVTPDGSALGTLCVIDHQPKKLDEQQLTALRALSKQVIRNFELKKVQIAQELTIKRLEQKNANFENFARAAAQDLKSPLNTISEIIETILHEEVELNKERKESFASVKFATDSLRNMITGILELSKSDSTLSENKHNFDINELLKSVINSVNLKRDYKIEVPFIEHKIFSNQIALYQVFYNIFLSSIQYNTENNVEIVISFEETKTHYNFSIKDNGGGVPSNHLASIFDMFKPVENKNFSHKSQSAGLNIVKNLIEGLGGKLSVLSVMGGGTTFSFSLPK